MTLTMSQNFDLFTSLRRDDALRGVPGQGPETAGYNYAHSSPLYMLDYHRDRMLRAALHWKWTPAVDALHGDEGLRRLADFIEAAVSGKGDPLRVKVLLSSDGTMTCESSVVPSVPSQNLFPRRLPPPGAIPVEGDPSKDNVFEILADTVPTERSEYTHYKTTHRAMYDGARSRAHLALADKKEILLVNQDDGSIMEGSLTTPWFWRGGRWVTPPVPSKFNLKEGSGGQDGTTRRWALEQYICSSTCILP